MKLYEKIMKVLEQKDSNKRQQELSLLCECLPKGKGLEKGCKILSKSTKNKFWVEVFYNHGHGRGYEDFTEHKVIVTRNYYRVDVKITGRNDNKVKEYLYPLFYETLFSEVVTNF